MIPDCYEAYQQEEARQQKWDSMVRKMPSCCICFRPMLPGDRAYTASCKKVCSDCMTDLEDSEEIIC